MAQFDVHLNPGPMRGTVPMVVVVVQSSLFDGYRRRVVVPLVLRTALPKGSKVAGTRLNPVFMLKKGRRWCCTHWTWCPWPTTNWAPAWAA
jgi:toxin CcdB